MVGRCTLFAFGTNIGDRMKMRNLLSCAGGALLAIISAPSLGNTINFGPDAGNYGILFEGGGGNTLQITNVTVNGNVGVGMTGKVSDGGPSTVNGRVDFSAANTGQFSNGNPGNVTTGGVHYNVAAVTSALNAVNGLNTALDLSGTGVNINGSTTINASSGALHTVGGVNYRIFTVTGFNTTNSDLLTINGDLAGDNVVLNFPSSANFNNQVALAGGLTADDVLYNFVGGSGLSGGPTLQINNNASSSSSNLVQGDFLNPNGSISVTNARVSGRVFGGDTHDFQYVSGTTLTAPPVPGPLPPPQSASGGLVLLGLLGGARFISRPAASH